MRAFGAWIGRTPSAVLVFFQLVQIVGYPFLDGSIAGRVVLAVLSVVVVLLAVWVVRRTPALTWVAALLALPALVFGVWEALAPGSLWAFVLAAVFHVLFYFYVTWSLIRYLFHDTRITADELFATLAAFTVVLWAFAYLILLTETFWPGSFNVFADADDPFFAALFLSTTTMTSVGLSDVLPTSDQGRAIMMIAEIVGLFYMALIVSRIIAISVNVARSRRSD